MSIRSCARYVVQKNPAWFVEGTSTERIAKCVSMLRFSINRIRQFKFLSEGLVSGDCRTSFLCLNKRWNISKADEDCLAQTKMQKSLETS